MKDTIKDIIENMSDNELMMIHNEYCDSTNDYDNRIYSMEEFDEVMNGTAPWDITKMVFYGDFNPNYEYFRFNGYGNLESIAEHYLDEHIYIDEIVDYIIDNNDSLYNDEIQNALDEFEVDEDE